MLISRLTPKCILLSMCLWPTFHYAQSPVFITNMSDQEWHLVNDDIKAQRGFVALWGGEPVLFQICLSKMDGTVISKGDSDEIDIKLPTQSTGSLEVIGAYSRKPPSQGFFTAFRLLDHQGRCPWSVLGQLAYRLKASDHGQTPETKLVYIPPTNHDAKHPIVAKSTSSSVTIVESSWDRCLAKPKRQGCMKRFWNLLGF